MPGLSEDEISQCINGKSSLNLTIENEMTVSYIQNENPLVSSIGRSNMMSHNVTIIPFKPKKKQASHKTPESTTGRCSMLMEAPPGKVLSVLFMNQTCSRDNQVLVHDIHDGWRTTLDGCSPWKSPGYDVTTANRSAVMVIDLHNLVSFFKLVVQIKAVDLRNTDGFLTRYVSSVIGYIQTLGWHPFTRPCTGTTQGTAIVKVPSNHVTLISVVYSYLHFKSFTTSISLVLNCTWKPKWKIFYYKAERPEVVLLPGRKFRLLFVDIRRYFFYGVRVLFSFHQYSLKPRRLVRGLWNCSVPSWPDFQQHFLCNNKTECVGREDEMWCADTSCEQGGIQLNDRCYIFIVLPEKKGSWLLANTVCKRRGAALTSFLAVNSWYHLSLLSQMKGSTDIIFTGLKSTDARYPHICSQHPRHWGMPSSQGVKTVISRQFCTAERFQAVGVGQSAKDPGLNSVPCPTQHRTHVFLARDAFSACCDDHDVKSSDVKATTDDAVTSVCHDVDVTSFKALFPCRSGASSVPYSLVCNHLQDCGDNSDEDFCVFPPCSAAWQYQCANGQCLQFHHHCDELVQCLDKSDEVDCVSRDLEYAWQKTFKGRRPPAVVDFDGRGWMIYTSLTTGTENYAMLCPDTHVFCPGEGYCLPVYVRCNSFYDCPGQEDEVGCDSYTCPGLYRCRGLLPTCLHSAHLCDGWPQCPEHDDEQFCNLTCPVDCTCLGLAFTCFSDFHVEPFSRLRYLDAAGTGLEPERLANNTMLVYLSLASCDLAYLSSLALPNLLNLDLSDNRFSVVTVADLNLMKNIQNLSLARNPFSNLFSGNYSSGFLVHEGILHVDVTGVDLKMLDVPSYLPFPKLLGLNLSGSGVTRLTDDGFSSLPSLQTLDLRGCPMIVFPRHLFKGLNNLGLVFADNYKLCCEASLPAGFNVDNCYAPFNEISSCDALLRGDIYRICLSVLAALALTGNFGCFCMRIFSLTGRGKTGFNVFVTHLSVSDFIMGVYMAMIGVADRLYLGIYLWEDGRWRHSAACQVAGVLALLSSEVSALIICLITLDRFLVIRFPFSRIRFSSFSAQVVSLVTWTVGIVLVAVPLLPVAGYRHFYGQTGICVPLPITRNDFAGHHYAFGIMILLNLIVFLVIASGQISVYLSMTTNAMSSIDTSRKSRDLIVARRLITVVVSDFLCWFPLGLLGVLAVQGVPVPGEVNVAMAIFVLPLNSALNPFLYTLNMIQEKRQRVTEVKLLKMIMDLGINDGNVNKE